ncbi:transcriptional regulator GcvA [Microvirga guangxiensis]|uniref:LysR family transcriptional regulator, glycine cleavage system transcriptional activator n=1 Tax=Microvirga guangxiensis TaxID=549386 RepID=A0A1G5G4H2_9HYPH|nr:transcriptional regulator GcvA [Microvirga guangxiensis]SCY46247.1 LysR family transcriptional regulator, glycine cleavage system transcriptional activator [Microvirga guangxiensis]
MARRRLPPLNSLRAFEAAARHLSFEKAGDEIAVTASAVGQQIKTLEGWLGRPLFMRLPAKGVALTPLGQRYAVAVTEILNRLDEATAQALKPENPHVITVSAMPSLASNWLIPRLGAFREREPEIDVRVSVSMKLTDFAREDVDIAIRFGRGHYPGLRTELLMEEHFFAVCSTALLNDPARPLREPEDLRHHTLIHEIADVPDYTTWDRWFSAIGVTGVDTSRGPRYSHTYLCLQAAAAGQGVALATSALIGDHLTAGRLVRPFPHQVRGAYQYYIVCPDDAADRPAIAAFRGWLQDEARAQNV